MRAVSRFGTASLALACCIGAALADDVQPLNKQQTRGLTARAAYADPAAQFELGLRYSLGRGAKRDSFVAVRWWARAAAQGHPEAMYKLGEAYRYGIGVGQDDKLAMLWFRTAADHGVLAAINAVGELYVGSLDIPQDFGAAFQWFARAASLGNAGALYNMGVSYALGRGVPQDDVEAYKWFDLAANADEDRERDKAIRARITIGERLTVKEIWTAKMEAQQWLGSGQPIARRSSVPLHRHALIPEATAHRAH